MQIDELAQIKADVYGCIAYGEIYFIDQVAFLKKLLPYLNMPETPTKGQPDDCKIEFEKYATENYYDVFFIKCDAPIAMGTEGRYANNLTEKMWRTWQAAWRCNSKRESGKRDIATVKESNAGPYLYVAGVQIFSWLGTMHNEGAHAIAKVINDAHRRNEIEGQ